MTTFYLLGFIATHDRHRQSLCYRCECLIATPGRLNDLIGMGKVELGAVSYLVLDEADRMLDMGFEPQIKDILSHVPTTRQTLLFTATMAKPIEKLAARY